MRTRLLASTLCTLALFWGFSACGGNNNNNGKPQCSDGKDNDGDGLIDFPDDPGCTSAEDDSEDSPPSPQCSDGRDNDGDGKIDYPNDPGCFSPLQDDETDDCPDGPMCPQCANLKDDDGNGLIDFPNDPGCSAASDTDEYTDNPIACGSNVHITVLPFNGMASGTLTGTSSLMSPSCGGSGPEAVYELRISQPKVVVATTDNPATTADTVLYLRTADCMNNTSELICNNNDPMASNTTASSITYSVTTPGTYYLVVDSWDSTGGNYALSVKYLTGEGQTCSGPDDCGPGLVCRIPLGGTMKVCAKPECSDGVDDDGDGKLDYPDDPGCTSPTDNDESDDCFPTVGPNCPECADGVDNDGDGKIDFGTGPNNDPTCTSASDTSEACVSTEGVTEIVAATTMGDNTTSHADITLTCADEAAPDNMYRLDLPALATLNITATANDENGFFDTALFNHTCAGTSLSCEDSETGISLTSVAAGTYYYEIASDFPGDEGPYTINVSGTVANGGSCENALFQAGVFTCNVGFACKGTMGSRTCQAAQCSDGLDNDGDGKYDYPFDPGCDSPGDDDETDPTTPPVCSDTMDNDADGLTDFPADYGCTSANGASEKFCVGEMDPTSAITTKTTTGTTAGKSNDLMPSCTTNSTAPDVAYGLMLPVQVATLQVDTIGSSFDTIVSLRDASCAMDDGCNDDGGGSLTSELTFSNIAAGGYAIIVDGYGTNSGAYTLNVHGTVAVGTRCDATSLHSAAAAALFAGGANAVLSCPASCSATTHLCL